jgi:hypothetical protein
MEKILWKNPTIVNETLPLEINPTTRCVTVESVFKAIRHDSGCIASKIRQSKLTPAPVDDAAAVNKLLSDALAVTTESVRDAFMQKRLSRGKNIIISPMTSIDLAEVVTPIERSQAKKAGSAIVAASSDKKYIDLPGLLEYVGSDRVFDAIRTRAKETPVDAVVCVNNGDSFEVKRVGVGMETVSIGAKSGMVRFGIGTSVVDASKIHIVRRWASYIVDEPDASRPCSASSSDFCAYVEVYPDEDAFLKGADASIMKVRATTTLVSAFDIFKTFRGNSKVTCKAICKRNNFLKTFFDSRAGAFPVEGLSHKEVGRFLSACAIKNASNKYNSDTVIVSWRPRKSPLADFEHPLATALATSLKSISNAYKEREPVVIPPLEISIPCTEADKQTLECIIADGETEFEGVSIRSAENGKWISVLDIGVKLDEKRSKDVLRDYGVEEMGTMFGSQLCKGFYIGKDNARHPDTFVSIDYLDQFIAEKVKNKAIAKSARDRIVALSREWKAGNPEVAVSALENGGLGDVAETIRKATAEVVVRDESRKPVEEEIVSQRGETTTFSEVELRSAKEGKWISVLDVGVKLDGKKTTKILRDYGLEELVPKNGNQLCKGFYIGKDNARHPDTFVRIDYLDQFIAEKVKNKAIAKPVRDRIAALSRGFAVGEQALKDALDRNKIIADAASVIAPDTGLAALQRVHEDRTLEEEERDESLLDSTTTALGVEAEKAKQICEEARLAKTLNETVVRLSPGKISESLKRVMDSAHFAHAVSSKVKGSPPDFFYAIYCRCPKARTASPIARKMSEGKEANVLLHHEDAPYGFIKYGITYSPLERLKTHARDLAYYKPEILMCCLVGSELVGHLENAVKEKISVEGCGEPLFLGKFLPGVGKKDPAPSITASEPYTETATLTEEFGILDFKELVSRSKIQLGLPLSLRDSLYKADVVKNGPTDNEVKLAQLKLESEKLMFESEKMIVNFLSPEQKAAWAMKKLGL